MTFDSLHFLFFFVTVVGAYTVLPRRYRLWFLFLTSCYFYMVFIPMYVLVLLYLIGVDFFLGKKIEATDGRRRKVYFVVSIIANLLILFVFKYSNFFFQNISEIASFIGWNYHPKLLQLLLPLGISFHTFQSLSYVIEVYRKKQPAEKSLLTYAVYVMFFPQLVAGPIERPQTLLPQLHALPEGTQTDRRVGFEIMMWGFFKKIVIANTIAPIVNRIFGYPEQYTGLPLIIATLLFGLQLYADFSGYSDIAVGTARVLGFRLTNNFDAPYFSRSVGEFWRRWHISLSNWLRDYLYYPFVFRKGTQMTPARLYIGFLLTFVLIGLWHGANWTYILMGGLHGVYLSVGGITANWRRTLRARIGVERFPRVYALWQVGVVCVLVSVSWVLFRAQTLSDAWYILTQSLSSASFRTVDSVYRLHSVSDIVTYIFGNYGTFWTIGISVAFLFAVEYRYRQSTCFEAVRTQAWWIRWSAYYGLLLWILFFGYFGSNPFIYFQF